MNLTPSQQAAIDAATSGNIGILTGGPGTGKTHSLAAFLRTYHGSVAVCAPTGKAAVRATEALRSHGVGLQATTIHGLLAPTRNGHDREGWNFGFNRSCPLEFSLIVGDEWSMVDILLQASFLEAIDHERTKVLLIGDPNQLPPVGSGRPFADMIASKAIPHGHLTEPHRFAGRIGTVCKAIHDGKAWEPSPSLDIDNKDYPENFRHIERPLPTAANETMLAVIDKMTARDLDPIEDMQVICAVNEKGPQSRKVLNKLLQRKLNPDGKVVDGCPFRVGDKMICLQNGFRNGAHDSDGEQIYVANGETGICVEVNPKFAAIKFSMGCAKFWKADWKLIDLGYAITGHKSQGSQWPVVISMIDQTAAADRVCSKAWHYTAFSRASKALFTIGRKAVVLKHCARNDIERRKTFLAERLRRVA